MRRIGGKDADIEGLYEKKGNNEGGATNMDKDKEEGTTRARRRGAAFDNNTTGKEDNDDDATDSMEDNDKGSEEDPHGHEKEYEEEYYQDLDGQLRRYGDLLVSGSDDELSFEKELSPKKRGNNNEPPAESGETSGSGTPLTEISAKKGSPAEKTNREKGGWREHTTTNDKKCTRRRQNRSEFEADPEKDRRNTFCSGRPGSRY